MPAAVALELLAGKALMGMVTSPPKEMTFITVFVPPFFSCWTTSWRWTKEMQCLVLLAGTDQRGSLGRGFEYTTGAALWQKAPPWTSAGLWGNCGRKRGKRVTSPLGFSSVRAPAEGAQCQPASESTFCRWWAEPFCPPQLPGKLALANHGCCVPSTSCHSLTLKHASPSRLGHSHFPAAELFSPVLRLSLPASTFSPSSWLSPGALPGTLRTDLSGPATALLSALLVPVASEHS